MFLLPGCGMDALGDQEKHRTGRSEDLPEVGMDRIRLQYCSWAPDVDYHLIQYWGKAECNNSPSISMGN